jgi:glutamyl-tRNA reductase
MTDPIHYTEIKYGFEYGAAKVERACSDKGRVMIDIGTPRQRVTIRVSRTGLIRVSEVTKNWDEDMTARRKKARVVEKAAP